MEQEKTKTRHLSPYCAKLWSKKKHFSTAPPQTERDILDGSNQNAPNSPGSLSQKIHAQGLRDQFLSDLETPELVALYADLEAHDTDGLRLFEAYLERALGDDWRQQLGVGGEAPGSGGFGRTMSGDEALRILGLEARASEDEIHAAHRDLMSKLHPDRGGSDYLAAKINQAKEILLPK